MKRLMYGLWAIVLGLSSHLWAQSTDTLPLSAPFQQALAVGTRSMDGQPGPAYWINEARYILEATVDPDKRRVTASGAVTYINNSPDTLSQLVLRLYQNIYRPDATRYDQLTKKELTDGMEIEHFIVESDTLIGTSTSERVEIQGTNLFLALPDGLLPGDSLQFRMDWAFTITNGNEIRMGTYGKHAYFVGYWYPQVAVYDDSYGWDTTQYTGLHEFYQDFADFDVRITAPDDLIVWGTGVLQRPDSVLTPVYAERLAQAAKTDSVVRVVGAEDYANDATIVQPNGSNTWHFTANHVPDAAFALSDYYYWDATSVAIDSPSRRVFIDACYQPKSRDFREVASYAHDIIAFLSDSLPGIPYPYPAMTVFNGDTRGFGGGMEFPMIVNDGSAFSAYRAFQLTHHEIAHTYFPFMTGINEHRHAFMDEGWAEYLPSDLLSLRGYGSSTQETVGSYARFAGKRSEQPLIVNAFGLRDMAYYSNAYYKPAVAYGILRKSMGDSLFKAALRTYIRRWEGKHPLPEDFFHTFDDVAGESLAWFWKPWFYDKATPDLALEVDKVKGKKVSLRVLNEGGLPVPVYLRITLSSGEKVRIGFPASVWKDGTGVFSFSDKFDDKILEVALGRSDVPDKKRKNNSFDVE